jgi:hypothetical protein
MPLHRLAFPFVLVAALATASAAERVRAPVPWKDGETIAYDTEALTRDLFEGEYGLSRTTDRTEIRAEAAGRDGFVLTWTTRDSRIEAVEGDRTLADLIAPHIESLDGIVVKTEVDRDGRYRRVRDLETVAANLREALKPYFLAGAERMIAKSDPKQSKLDREAALAQVRDNLAQHIDELVSLDSIEAIASDQTRTFGAFAGLTLTPGRTYRDTAPLRSPEEGLQLPAKREYVLTLDRDDPNLARIRWMHVLDGEGDAGVLWRFAVELIGGDEVVPQEGRPKDLALREEGLMVFRRDTGAIELLETVTTSHYGALHDKRARLRMRLIGGSRTWAQEDAARR